MLQTLPIALALVQAGNTKEITKVYDNIINSIKV